MFVFCCSHATLQAILGIFKKHVSKENAINRKFLKHYLLPKQHVLYRQLDQLFDDPHMFRSPENFSDAGFDVKLGHQKLMVGFHPSIPQYVVKKFTDNRPHSKQLENYTIRIDGAEILRKYIKDHHFKHLVVPQKWLYPLPKRHFKKKNSYVLIVENMNIYDDWDDPNGEARRLYYNMNKEMVTELCMILHDVGGCDAYPWNQPFTHSGKIAFVDTEHVGKFKYHDYFIRHIVPSLNEGMQAYAIALWNQLVEEKNRKSDTQDEKINSKSSYSADIYSF